MRSSRNENTSRVADSALEEAMDRGWIISGEECDHCRRRRRELGVYHLQTCSRCKMAHYCGRECQKRH